MKQWYALYVFQYTYSYSLYEFYFHWFQPRYRAPNSDWDINRTKGVLEQQRQTGGVCEGPWSELLLARDKYLTSSLLGEGTGMERDQSHNSHNAPVQYLISLHFGTHIFHMDLSIHIPQHATLEQKCAHFCSNVVHCGISQGYDDIPGKLLRLAPHLTYLINECLRTSAFPHNMKNAELSPVYKKHDNLDKVNYRHVSVLTAVSVMNRSWIGHQYIPWASVCLSKEI